MGDIGFELKPSPKGPLPDADDLAWLGVLLGFFVLLPIGVLMGELVRPLVITFIYLATVLTPVVMAHALPNFAMRRGGQRPAIAFPLSVGVVVVAIQLVLGFTFLLEGSLGERLDAFSSTAFPWTVFTFVISVLLALRMRIGAYPDLGTLQAQPWRQWGDLRDGLWLATFGAAVTILFFAPRLFEAPSGSALKMLVGQLTIPPVIAFVLGFLVPTWYRAKLKAKDEARAVPQGSPTGTETPATT